MKELIYKMLESEDLALNVKTAEEANEFIDACKELEIEDNDEFSLTGEEYFEIYKDKTCFTLETGVVEYCDTNYFEENGYDIITM